MTWTARFSLRLACAVSMVAASLPAREATAAVVPPPILPTPKNIQAGIDRAKKYVYGLQREGGRWEKDEARQGTDHAEFKNMQGDTFGGYTALATYALLASGENPNDPRIKSAVAFLKQADIVGIYALAMRCQVWNLIPHESPEMRALIRKDAEALLRGLNDGSLNPKNKGMWDYLGQGPRLDHSVSQYGVLGLWACQQTGAVEIGTDRWKTIETAWRGQQYAEGGWDYGTMSDQTFPMTAAGVASLFIVGDYLHTAEGVGCLGNGADPFIDKGLAWLDKHYDQVELNGYAMYGVERIGAASGYKYFSAHDWFTDLARRILESQQPDGSFTCAGYQGAQILDGTCFGLLFLARGRAPVMMNKLDYHEPAVAGAVPDPANWNERPRDIANLAAFAGRQAESFLQWQIVNFAAPADDLHDAPILYLSGNLELKPGFEDARKLKAFVEEGGMILGNADCGRPAFAKSFEALGGALFGRRFRELPADHPIFTHEQFPAARWRTRPRVLGLSNGARELMVLIPEADAARWWQDAQAWRAHADSFELGTDLFQYAVDRKVWNKGDSYVVRPNPKVAPGRAMKLARVVLGANWDPEPGGWRRLAATLHNDDDVALTLFNAAPGQGGLTAAKVAHLTGTEDFTLKPEAALEIKSFVQNGGTLIVDAAGGSSAFAAAAERELRGLFGDAAAAGLAQPLPRSHPVFNQPGHRITEFTYRAWSRLRSHGSVKEPRVRGIAVGSRIGVFYSPEDLSVGLVGQPVDGIDGYSPETATAIMTNILLYSAGPEPATGPATQTPGKPRR